MFAKKPIAEIEKALQAFEPALVGFSIRNLDNESMLELQNPLLEIKEFVTVVKNHGITTVLGGVAFTTLPREMLAYMGADYGIAGQGEESLPSLVSALESGADVTGIPGLVYRDGSTVLMSSPPVIKGYGAGVRADWSAIDLKPYKKNAIIAPPGVVVVKIGCPFQCTYCDAKNTMGSIHIFRSPEDIIEEIRAVKNAHHIHNFFLADSCFNSPLDKAKDLLRTMIDAKLKIRFMLRCNPFHDGFDEEFFTLLKRAGGYCISSSIDSFSDTMLENYRKPFRTADIIEFGELARHHGISFIAELLFGGPGETNETIRESMALLPRVEFSRLEYAIGVRINPGTAVFDAAVKTGVVSDASELLFAKFYISREVDVEWAKKFIDQNIKKFSSRNWRMLPMIMRNVKDAII
jgi:radical SAM superfamily enzyme YgiQ (UPF0313 family)